MRKLELGMNLGYFSPILILLALGTIASSSFQLFGVGLIYAFGIVDLVYAKIPEIQQGILFSFGPAYVPFSRRAVYRRGYQRLALGFALQVIGVAVQLATGSFDHSL